MKKTIKELFQNENKAIIYTSVFIAILSFILYFPSIDGSFVYDDSFYITDNYYTQDFTSEGLQKIWSHYVFGNYNPLTITSLALDYELFGNNTIGYHTVNILFHILISILIIFFVKDLTGDYKIGIITSIIFVVHPLHVESVSWISGRKDVLFTFFFILSLILYLKYLKERTPANYTLLFIFFILSCLSKAVAVVLPVILLLIDYFNHRKINKQSLLEKLPLFVVSIVIGIVAIDAQTQEGALRLQEQYGILDKIMLSGYAIYSYLEKLIAPNNLSANYPFPKRIDGMFPSMIYIGSALSLTVFVVTFFIKKISRKVKFAVMFFTITIFPVLQIVAVGNAITADRFAYLPSLALCLLAAWGIHFLFIQNKDKKLLWLKKEIVPIVIFGVVFFSYTTYNRAKVWENEFTLYSDMIEKNPDIAFYYNNLGLAYLDKKKGYKEARELLEKAISLKPNYSMAFNNLGNLFSDLKNFDEAKKNYEYAIKSDSLNSEAFNNLGVLYLDKNDIDNAWKYLRKAVMLDKNYFDALNNYATVLIAKKNFTEAKKYLIKAMTLNRKSAKPFINFGLLFYEQNNNNKAEEYLLMALEKEPENKDALSFLNFIRNPESRLNSDKEGKINSQEMKLFEKGVKLMSSGNFPEAEKIFILVTENNTKFANAFEKLAIAQTNLKKYDDALRAFSKALEIEPNSPVMLKNMAVVYQKTGKIDKVIECYQKAARLGDIPAQEWLNLNGIKW